MRGLSPSMEERNLTLEITEDNWKNWVMFILTIYPVSERMRREILDKIGEEEEW